MNLGASEYRRGALERLQESYTLLLAKQYAGGIYLAGRAVEGILRAAVWTGDLDIQHGRKALQTGHDLRELLTLVRNLGLLRESKRDDELHGRVQRIALLWFNDMRFASSKFIEARWRRAQVVTNRTALKAAALQFYDDCSFILQRCERLCVRAR